jgi:3-oxoacyl-[acyl-carrier protein] reductase
MAKLRGSNLAGRVLITGASRGIGRAIALQLARAGFPVALNYRQRCEEAEKTQAMVRDLGGDAALLPFDVADRAACAEALESDLVANGAFFGVVCNAGVHEDAPFPGLTGEAWDRVIRTNLDGFYNVVHPLVMPMVRARSGGRIVTIASASGLMGNRGQVNYSASKAGLIGATRALAIELAKRCITVNSVAPGLIETEMTEGLPVEEVSRLIPMQRMGKPEEVAAAVGFLFSAEASYITGQVISVNGGLA